MDKRFLEYGKAEVFKNRSLLNQFLKEYKQYFGKKPEPSCSKCRTEYWNNYINLINDTMATKKCKYRLKAKYNGVSMADKVQIFNSEMTDEKAKELLLWHPAHELLFDILPDEIEVIETVDNIAEIVVKKIPKKKKPKRRTPKNKK